VGIDCTKPAYVVTHRGSDFRLLLLLFLLRRRNYRHYCHHCHHCHHCALTRVRKYRFDFAAIERILLFRPYRLLPDQCKMISAFSNNDNISLGHFFIINTRKENIYSGVVLLYGNYSKRTLGTINLRPIDFFLYRLSILSRKRLKIDLFDRAFTHTHTHVCTYLIR
jgi:hypothetical protein